MAEIFPNVVKNINLQNQEAQQMPNKYKESYITVILLRAKDKEKIFTAARGK